MTTPAGTFTNCLQTQWIWSLNAETGKIETKVLAKGVGEVKVWESSLSREKNGFAAEAFHADTEYKEAIEICDPSPLRGRDLEPDGCKSFQRFRNDLKMSASLTVTPARAGIQNPSRNLDSRFRAGGRRCSKL